MFRTCTAGNEEFTALPHRATAGIRSGNVIGDLPDLGDGCGHGHAEAAMAHRLQIYQIIAHEGGGRRVHPEVAAEFAQRLPLVVNPLEKMADPEIRGTVFNNPRTSAGDNGSFDPCFLGQLDTQSVLDVESLHDLPVVAIKQASVGHDAVDVKGNEANLTGFRVRIHAPVASNDLAAEKVVNV